jgi:hypothetical protein
MKSKSFLPSLILTALTFFSATWSFAANGTPRSPYSAVFSLSQVYEAAEKRDGTKELETLPTVKLQGRLRSIGFVDARFSSRRNKTWTSSIRRNGREQHDSAEPVLLQGRLVVGGSWRHSGKRILPASASIIGNELKVTFPGRATGSRRTRQRIYTITMKLDGSLVVQARVGSIPRSVGRRGACAAETGVGSLAAHIHAGDEQHAEEVIAPITAKQDEQSATLSRVITISTDADPEWYLKYGEQSNAVIASIINTAEAVFHRQLGLRFRIVKQHVYADTSPYTSTNSSRLLWDFSRNPENFTNLGNGVSSFHQDVDLKHLFTGKDIDGSVIGIAYIGVVCALPSMSYGVTQSYMDIANPAIFAHELGHNFGAMHDSSTRDGLMYPAISVPPAQGFSEQTLLEINRHLSKYGTCISLETLTPLPGQPPTVVNPIAPNEPTPAPATLTLKRERVKTSDEGVIKLSGSLTSSWLEPIGSVGIRLMVEDQEIGRAVTKANGRFVFFVRLALPQGKRVSVVVKTEGGDLISNELQLSRTISTRSIRTAKVKTTNTDRG